MKESANSRFARQHAATWPVVGLFAISLSPIWVVDMPAMIDYPKHRARIHILAVAGASEANPFYWNAWQLYRNLAANVVVPQLGRFMTVEAGMKTLLTISQVMIFTSAMALEYQAKGRVVLSGFAVLRTLHRNPFKGGQINFEFGMGVALFGAASWFAFAFSPMAKRASTAVLWWSNRRACCS